MRNYGPERDALYRAAQHKASRPAMVGRAAGPARPIPPPARPLQSALKLFDAAIAQERQKADQTRRIENLRLRALGDVGSAPSLPLGRSAVEMVRNGIDIWTLRELQRQGLAPFS